MSPELHIVASCADRKTVPVPTIRRLGSHRSTTHHARFARFVEQLQRKGDAVPARDLYAGPYWAVVRDLPAVAARSGVNARLWVASAGYGLVPDDASLLGYSATFRVGERDSVATSSDDASIPEQLSAWWSALCAWEGPSRGTPRSIARIARAHPRAHIMVLAAPRYVQALEQDLREAATVLRDRLLVVTSLELPPHHPLAGCIVPSQERLIGEVEGARPALHARVARHILECATQFGLSASQLRVRYTRLAENSKYERPPTRTPMTDDQVRQFIRRQFRSAPGTSCTRLLRILRDGGLACEQKRFRSLYRETVDSHAA